MPYHINVDAVDQFDFTETVLYTSSLYAVNALAKTLRRPMSHSAARALQQFVAFTAADQVFHLQRSDLANIIEFDAASDFFTDAAGRRWGLTTHERQTDDTRLLVVARPQLDPALVSHLRFEETDFNRANDDVNGDFAQLENGLDMATAGGPGIIGRAITLAAPADRLDLALTGVGGVTTVPIALSLWFKKTTLTAGHLFDFDQFQLEFLTGPTRLRLTQKFTTTHGIWDLTVTIVAGTWYHLVLNYARAAAASEPSFFFNGVNQVHVETQTPVGTVISDAASNKYLGNNQTGANIHAGSLDDVRIYNQSRTLFDVETLYRMGSISD